jgi:hypothetical protein
VQPAITCTSHGPSFQQVERVMTSAFTVVIAQEGLDQAPGSDPGGVQPQLVRTLSTPTLRLISLMFSTRPLMPHSKERTESGNTHRLLASYCSASSSVDACGFGRIIDNLPAASMTVEENYQTTYYSRGFLVGGKVRSIDANGAHQMTWCCIQKLCIISGEGQCGRRLWWCAWCACRAR